MSDVSGADDWRSNNPEELNKEELKSYYRWRGMLGNFQLLAFAARNIVLSTIARNSLHPALTVLCQRLRGVRIGRHVYIGPRVEIDLMYPSLVEIGDFASIGMDTMIFAHANPSYSLYLKRKYFPRKVSGVKIGEGAWVSVRTLILAGANVGKHSVVAAGAVVTGDVEDYSVAGGVPAKQLRKLE